MAISNNMGIVCRYGKDRNAAAYILMIVCLAASLLTSFKCTFATEKDYELSERDATFGLHFKNSNEGWAVGKNGLILKTVDGGTTWHKLEVKGRDSLNAVTFVGTNGWIVGNDGTILYSNNNGEKWERKQVEEKYSSVGFTDITFINENVGLIVGEMGVMLRTKDAGESWDDITLNWIDMLPPSLTDRAIYALNLYQSFFLDNGEGWIVGDWGTVLHSDDYGSIWTIYRMGYFPHLFSICFMDNQNGYAVGQNGTFLVTSDGGKTWNQHPDIETEDNLFKITLEGRYGVAVGDMKLIYESSDAGKHWERVMGTEGVYCDLMSCSWFSDVSFTSLDSSGEYFAAGWPAFISDVIEP